MATFIEITAPSTGAHTVFSPPIGRIEITAPSTGTHTRIVTRKRGGITVGIGFGGSGMRTGN